MINSFTPQSRAQREVEEFERQRGSTFQKKSKDSGYDLRVVNNSNEMHIEIKGIEKDDTFFAVNGLSGIRNLIFDENYYIYFCVVDSAQILICKRDFIEKNMDWESNKSVNLLMRAWVDTAQAIREISEIGLDARIRFHLKYPIKALISALKTNPKNLSPELKSSIDSLWEKDSSGSWVRKY